MKDITASCHGAADACASCPGPALPNLPLETASHPQHGDEANQQSTSLLTGSSGGVPSGTHRVNLL